MTSEFRTAPLHAGDARREQPAAQRDEIERLVRMVLDQPQPVRKDVWFLPLDFDILVGAVIKAWSRSGPGLQAPSRPQVNRRLRKLWADGQLVGDWLPLS